MTYFKDYQRYCQNCGGYTSERVVRYCKSKNYPVTLCYMCQDGTKQLKPEIAELMPKKKKPTQFSHTLSS